MRFDPVITFYFRIIEFSINSQAIAAYVNKILETKKKGLYEWKMAVWWRLDDSFFIVTEELF